MKVSYTYVFAALYALVASSVVDAAVGKATWYEPTLDGKCPGAKTYGTKLVFAMKTPLFKENESKCGQCMKITGPNGTVVARFVDQCGDAGSCKELDLSKDTFAAIADLDKGIINIQFGEFVPCNSLPGATNALTSDASIPSEPELIAQAQVELTSDPKLSPSQATSPITPTSTPAPSTPVSPATISPDNSRVVVAKAQESSGQRSYGSGLAIPSVILTGLVSLRILSGTR